MNSLAGKDIIGIEDLEADDVRTIFDVAKQMEPFAFRQKITRVLEGAILVNLFFEPSTRTRISFGTAFNRLGGAVRDTSGIETTSLIKGENLADTARVVQGYADVITVRHPKTGVAKEVADAVNLPVINGGDGVGEHPTQALLDVYTIENRLGEAHGRTIAMVGDLKFSRVIHSFTRLLCKMYEGIHFKCIAPHALQMPENIQESVRGVGRHHAMSFHDAIADIADADVVYMTRTQEERFADPAEYERYRGKLRIDRRTLDTFGKPDVFVMHPMPRDSREASNELDHDLDEDPRLAIFEQASNGVPVRMAIFALVLDVADQLERTMTSVNWHVSGKG